MRTLARGQALARRKSDVYARAGIAEYRVLDLNGRRLVAHRQPTARGYAEVMAYSAEETIAPLARPDASARVLDLLPSFS